ncbi:MAG: Gfo/Idh/MocA family oxidoreductase [Caldilineaceae bacterium]
MARQAVEEGRLGDLVFAIWRFGGDGSSDHPHANLIETQCHAFDQLEWLCGPIDSVMAEMTDKTGGGFRTLVLALHFTNGAVGSLIGTYDSSCAYSDTHRLEINGTEGRVVVEDTVRRYAYQAAGNETAEVWQAGYFNDRDRGFTAPLTGTSTTCCARSGMASHRRFLPRRGAGPSSWHMPRSSPIPLVSG